MTGALTRQRFSTHDVRTVDIQLFLAHADDQEPVLSEGVPIERTLEVRPAAPSELVNRRVAKLDGPPDALAEQQWAIVAPSGSEGERLLALVEPLRRKRAEEQGREVLIYRVDPDMDGVAAMNWIQGPYRNAVERNESARPRYLALLGGPDLISWDFQQSLAEEAFVGRIAFEQDDQYAAYVDKLVRLSGNRDVPRAKALFHAVLDGSRATQEGNKHLVVPSLAWARAAHEKGLFGAENILDIPMDSVGSRLDSTMVAGSLMRESAAARAGFLFTMSHGAGVPRDGWKSIDEQRQFQGAMVLGRKGDLLSANDIAKTPFLPGGIWFMFACYGAGTPAKSAYFPWLERMHELGMLGKSAEHVLAALPRPGERPFVAALPQAALANPDGPLGFVGHIDLAWSWSFLDYDVTSTGLVPKTRAERFQSVLRAFAEGHRFGVAHHELVKFYRMVNAELMAMDDALAQRTTKAPDFVEDRATRIRRVNLWMQRQDLSAYVLLGDPAARLPIACAPPGILQKPEQPIAIHSGDGMDRADEVLAILRGLTSINEVAKRLAVPRSEVESWRDTFVEAGRAALEKKS